MSFWIIVLISLHNAGGGQLRLETIIFIDPSDTDDMIISIQNMYPLSPFGQPNIVIYKQKYYFPWSSEQTNEIAMLKSYNIILFDLPYYG